MDAFNKRSKMKLQELVNPTGDAVGVLDTGKSFSRTNPI